MDANGTEIVPWEGDRRLVLLEDACKAIAQARNVEEVLLIRDQAEAFRYFAKRRGLGREAMLDAAEIKLRAERRMGEMLRASPGHGSQGGNRKSSDIVPLEALGVGRKDSSRWQQSLAVPDDRFEEYIAEARQDADKKPPTTSGLLRLAKVLQRPGQKPPDADREYCTVDDLESLLATGQRFGTIYADPPWQYGNQGTRASTDNHYCTMTIAELAALPVAQLAAENAHLHLWTTNGFIAEALGLMSPWGFEYKSMFVWCKNQMGIGNYWRVSHELLLLGVRGDTKRFQVRNLRSWEALNRGKHSSKPGRVRALIEKASPGPRLELFARLAHPGWTVWGNEIPRELFNQGGESDE